MAGGSGIRLWPLSRQSFPKQFVPLGGEHSLFQQAVLRVQGEQFYPPLVLGHSDHRFLLAEHVRDLGLQPSAIVLEPASRDTSAAACVAALQAMSLDPEALVLLMPCDHLIPDSETFRAAILRGVAPAQAGSIVVFGVLPTSPNEGFGYIECERVITPDLQTPLSVVRFVEKPNRALAEQFVKSRRYCWNAGIFLFRAAVLIDAFERHARETLMACRDAIAQAVTDLDFVRLDSGAYQRAEKISLDFAIIEKSKGLACVPLHCEWSDCGTWAAIEETLPRDAFGNVTKGDVIDRGSTNCLTYNSSNLAIVTIGLESILTVVTDDSVLVASKGQAGQLKSTVEQMLRDGREHARSHRRVYRPWGWFEGLGRGNRYQVKCIMLRPGGKLSLQSHKHRTEHWIVVSGEIEVSCGERTFTLKENQSTFIPAEARHRMSNAGQTPSFVIEVQSGPYLGEDDIQRFDDVYGRV